MVKRELQYWAILVILLFFSIHASAALNITYTSPGAYTVGTTITTLSPTVTGGTVTTGGFSPIYSFSTVNAPWDVTVDAAGNVYTVSETGNTLIKITPTGTATTLATNTSGLNAPTGVAIDGLGNIYVSNFGTNQVLKFNTSGTLLSTINGFNQPYGISFDASNNAYVGDVGSNTVIKITAGTTTTSTYVTGLTTPYGTAVDPSGNLYVSEYTVNNDIIKVTPAGVKSVFATGFNAPRQLGSDAAGNIYVADYGNNVVKKITSAGFVSTISTATGLSTPRSIQVDNVGSIYIADYGNNAIKKVAATGYVISAPLPAGLSFDTSTGKISGTPTVAFSSTTYKIIAYNATGKSNTASVTLSCTQTTVDWKGGTSTAWATASNWSPATVPNQYTAVRIGSNTTFTNQPTLSASTTVSSVTFGTSKTATLSIATGATLTINDNLTINSGGVPTIKGTGTAALNLGSGSVTTISGTTSSLTLTSPLTVTLMSDATGDATIGPISTGSTITGTAATSINVQRYLQGGSSAYRGYRLLSSPVNNGTDTHSNNCYGINYLKNSMILTATTTTGGFDNPAAANPTLYLYRETLTSPVYTNYTGSNFRGINKINNAPTYMYTLDVDGGGFYIPVGNGFLCFFRGDRSATTYANETTVTYVPQPVTLTATGTLNIGQITVKDWFTPTSSNLSFTSASPVAGFNLIGNPYASAIDWDTFQTSSTTTGIYGTGVASTMYVLDPVTKNYGAYIAGAGGVGSATFVSNIISSGQGFFVLATSTSGKLIINESAKTTAQNTGINLLLDKQAPIVTNNQYMRFQMSKDSANYDETLLRFNNQATLNFNPTLDAPYVAGFGTVNLATRTNDHINLSINTAPLPKQQPETILMAMNAKSDGAYTISLKDIQGIPQLFDIWLMDNYKKDSLNMRNNKTYNFNILKSDSGSFGPKRFALVIRQNPAYAYKLLSFAAAKIPNATQVQVTWNASNEQNYTNFTIERSTDGGKTYNVIGSVASSDQGTYSLVDKTPITGKNMYRLKSEDYNNTITYSDIVPVQISNTNNIAIKGNLSIFPNPANSLINLNIIDNNTTAVTYNIQITNSTGFVIKQATSAQTSWQSNVSDLLPGTYILKVFNTKDNKLIGDTKFVKL